MNLKPSDILKLEHASAFNFESINIRSFKGVSTDSRTVKAGELFFALRGEKFDGHQFVIDAFKAGAACAVVDHCTKFNKSFWLVGIFIPRKVSNTDHRDSRQQWQNVNKRNDSESTWNKIYGA
jgi:UDP-N-acetylmuramyl pentapeptide synthase